MGSIVKSIGKAVKSVVKGVVNFVKKYIKQIVIIVVVAAAIYFTAGAAAPAVAGAAGGGGAAVTGAGVGVAAPTTAAAGSAITGSATTNAILAGGTSGASATSGAIAAASAPTVTTAGLAPALTTGVSAGASTAVNTGVGAVGTGLEGTTGIAIGEGAMPAAELNALNAAKAANAATNYVEQAAINGTPMKTSEGINLVAKDTLAKMNVPLQESTAIQQSMGMTPTVQGKASESFFSKAGKTVMNYADKHPIQTGIAMQAAGGALKAAFTPGEEEADFGGLATREGKVWDGNGLVDYKDSGIASQEFKQQAGVAPGVAPVAVTATPQAELPTPQGLINPPTPATVSVASGDAEQVNKGLLGNVKITGT